jgi:hypothetical protein
MKRIWLAIRVFFLVLFYRDAYQRVLGALATEPAPAKIEPPREAPKPATKPPVRSEALTLLAALQREARFVDFLMESLADYSDAQIGAVARDVHRDCGKVVERLFALKPVCGEPEGAAIEVPEGFDAVRYHLVGNVGGAPPFRGRLVHPGWEATRCELPKWSGGNASARIVTPIEVEL